MITPVFEGGAQGPPIPFTQFIQQPTVARCQLDKALTIPDGGTAVLYAGSWTRQESAKAEDCPAPLFAWISDLMGLFAEPPAPTSVHENLFVLVTPRVIVNAADEAKKPTEMLPMPKVVRMPAGEEQSAPKPAQPAAPCCNGCPLCTPGQATPPCCQSCPLCGQAKAPAPGCP